MFQELFIEDLSRQTLENGKGKSNVEYGTLADMVNTDDTLAFLQGIVLYICPKYLPM